MLLSDNVVTSQKMAIFIVTTMRQPKPGYMKLYSKAHYNVKEFLFIDTAKNSCL